jgi:glycosyltransferase involved in cell wall biosynthesis
MWLAKLFGKKVILHVHASNGKVMTSNREFLHQYAKWVLRSADMVIALSPRYALELHNYCKDAKIVVISNPCLISKDSKFSEHTGSSNIFFAGWLDENKGFCDLIKAMPLVKNKIPNAQLLLAGFGCVDRGKVLARSLNVESSVHFLGWLTGDDMAKTFQRADVFCLPSYNEGVPVALLEAMGYGLPVICTPVGGIPDVIENNINGVFVTPGNVTEIADAIVKILTDDDFRRELGRAAMQTINTGHSVDVVCDKLNHLYCQMINE